MIHYQFDTIKNKTIEISKKEYVSLGPQLTLIECSLNLRTNAQSLTLTDIDLVDCTISSLQPMRNYQMWCNVRLRGCKFLGMYIGNDFGNWPEMSPHGYIEACDFSNATLDGCRLFGCNLDSMVLPTWPSFAFVHPATLKDRIDAVAWPLQHGIWAGCVGESPSESTVAIFHAELRIAKYGGTLAELKKSLLLLGDSVIM